MKVMKTWQKLLWCVCEHAILLSCMCVFACVRACVRACVCVCVNACVCACMHG